MTDIERRPHGDNGTRAPRADGGSPTDLPNRGSEITVGRPKYRERGFGAEKRVMVGTLQLNASQDYIGSLNTSLVQGVGAINGNSSRNKWVDLTSTQRKVIHMGYLLRS